MRTLVATLGAACLAIGLLACNWAWGNAGPFQVYYPLGGNAAAKGVVARLDPWLKPARESRLRVVKENLTICFPPPASNGEESLLTPIAAEYTVENPTGSDIELDFGFPILRDIYRGAVKGKTAADASRQVPQPISVTVDGRPVKFHVITDLAIFGVIRREARATIDKAIAADKELARLVEAVRKTRPSSANAKENEKARQAVESAFEQARVALSDYLIKTRKWNARNAALMVEYTSVDFTDLVDQSVPSTEDWRFGPEGEFPHNALAAWSARLLGPLTAIGPEKATQLFAELATQFDPSVRATYEAIFAAWGGDIRQQAIDLPTGAVRPRQNSSLTGQPVSGSRYAMTAPNVFVRIEELEKVDWLSKAERTSCQSLLRNLPVTFTFAPMNLIHYHVSFPARATRTVRVAYSQHPYIDTGSPGSYQIAYVLHPATFWDHFGPIELTVSAPNGITCRASTPITPATEAELRNLPPGVLTDANITVYRTTLTKPDEKRGELFVAIDQTDWLNMVRRSPGRARNTQVQPAPP